MDASRVNSHELVVLSIQITKTVLEEGEWRSNQKEFCQMIKNWESFDQVKFYEVLEILENLERKEVEILWNVIDFRSLLWLGIYTHA